MRVFMPEMNEIEVPVSYLSLFSNSEVKNTNVETINAPEIVFADIEFPAEKKAVIYKTIARTYTKPAVIKTPEMDYENIAPNELSFDEPVKLSAIAMNNKLPMDLVTLYKEYSYEMVAESAPIQDEVSTKVAATVEPEFFSYDEAPVKEETPVKNEVPAAPEVASADNNVENVENVNNVENVDKAHVEEISLDEMVAFDYSKAKEDVKTQSMPVISTVVSPKNLPIINDYSAPKAPKYDAEKPVTTQPEEQNAEQEPIDNNKGLISKTFSNRVTIQLSGTDLKKTDSVVGFELRFQDDVNETVQDFNSGSILIEQDLAETKMTRSVTVLKRGFAPTNTDLILEEGDAELTLPVIEEDTFNELMSPFESRGPLGAVLVELDDATEGVSLDVPYSQVLRLTEDMQVTEGEDFNYQLFVGVKAGNALLSYKDANKEVINKITHVHERELTFESNIYEKVSNDKVKLVEEDLLGKEKTPLIISSNEVKQFATEKTASKINNHTHRTHFKRTLLGGRRYLELSHQSEPVFVGLKTNEVLEIPSENFMRFVLSRFEGSSLGNRCLVQVNLKKKPLKVDVGSESVGDSLMTSTQILDADGKFYDSIGEKSQKIIVVGENQGAPELSQDSKINLKITYQDGSVQFLGSYCSPNTYLVEQL